MWLSRLIGATWFRAALIGSVVVAFGLVLGWSYGKGYDAAEDKYQKAMTAALEDQLERLTTIHQKDMRTAAKQQTKVTNVKWRIKDVFRPDCQLSTECVRAFNDGVRASGTNTPGVDSAAGTD